MRRKKTNKPEEEIDGLLKETVNTLLAGVELPSTDQMWEKIASRLASPLPAKKSRLPLLLRRWAAAAAVAVLVFWGAWKFASPDVLPWITKHFSERAPEVAVKESIKDKDISTVITQDTPEAGKENFRKPPEPPLISKTQEGKEASPQGPGAGGSAVPAAPKIREGKEASSLKLQAGNSTAPAEKSPGPCPGGEVKEGDRVPKIASLPPSPAPPLEGKKLPSLALAQAKVSFSLQVPQFLPPDFTFQEVRALESPEGVVIKLFWTSSQRGTLVLEQQMFSPDQGGEAPLFDQEQHCLTLLPDENQELIWRQDQVLFKLRGKVTPEEAEKIALSLKASAPSP